MWRDIGEYLRKKSNTGGENSHKTEEKKIKETKKILAAALRIFLAVLETAAVLIFAGQMPRGITNIGAFFGLFMSLALLFITVFFKQVKKFLSYLWKRKAGKVFIAAFGSVLGLLCVYAVILSSLMIKEIYNAPKQPDAVIVLGCRVEKSGKPSLMLRRRLEAAHRYLEEHEDLICVVAGGKGEDEPVSEAKAMKDALVEMGIKEERIITEDDSESTEENIAFSARLLSDMGIEAKEIALVTDGFHLYRTGLMAERAGIETTSVCADTPWYMVPSYWFREWFALSAVFVFN